MKILVIEDDAELAEFLKMGFHAEGVLADVALDGQRGSFIARTNAYEVIVLDLNLPKKSGQTVCREIREAGKHIPIIVLSVHDGVHEKVDLLKIGADDYLVKPFSFDELFARIKALARRPPVIKSDVLTAGDISIDISKQTVTRGTVGIYLTKKEFTLLEYLVRNKGMLLSRGMIMEHVWNMDSDPFSNTIEAHILNLRKKITPDGKKSPIKNIPGRGYMIE